MRVPDGLRVKYLHAGRTRHFARTLTIGRPASANLYRLILMLNLEKKKGTLSNFDTRRSALASKGGHMLGLRLAGYPGLYIRVPGFLPERAVLG